MKLSLLFLCFLLCDAGFAISDWSNIDLDEISSFKAWKQASEKVEKNPEYFIQKKLIDINERYGRVISCMGRCEILRDDGIIEAGYRNTIREGDELVTSKDSYAWVYLLDGSMVRVSPKSSITFFEFNVSKKDFHHIMRINWGNVFVLGFEYSKFHELDLRETDTIFLPLRVYEANYFIKGPIEYQEGEFFDEIEKSRTSDQAHMTMANSMISVEKFPFLNKKRHFQIVLPNGTVEVDRPILDVVVSAGGKSVIHQRESSFYYSTPFDVNISLTLRTLNSDLFEQVEPGMWIEISEDGKEMSESDRSFTFERLVFPTSFIPSIVTMRNIQIKRYLPIFEKGLNNIDGHFLWGNFENKNSDLNKRMAFVRSYIQKSETLNLPQTIKIMSSEDNHFFDFESNLESPVYYSFSRSDYMRNFSNWSFFESDREILNSTTKRLWKVLNNGRKTDFYFSEYEP